MEILLANSSYVSFVCLVYFVVKQRALQPVCISMQLFLQQATRLLAPSLRKIMSSTTNHTNHTKTGPNETGMEILLANSSYVSFVCLVYFVVKQRALQPVCIS